MLKIAIYLQTPPRGPVTFPMTKKAEKAGISHLRVENLHPLRSAILYGILTVFAVSTIAICAPVGRGQCAPPFAFISGIFRASARVTFGRSPKSDQKDCLTPAVSRLPPRPAHRTARRSVPHERKICKPPEILYRPAPTPAAADGAKCRAASPYKRVVGDADPYAHAAA